MEYAKRPPDTPYSQQKLPSWSPLLTSYKLAAIYSSIAVVFLILGPILMMLNDEVIEYSMQYDGDGTTFTDCQITEQDEAQQCTITFNVEKKIPGPAYVFYGIDKFYQNHRRYVSSYSQYQLLGSTSTSDVSDCSPLTYNGSKLLSPCGLIANTLFNDVIVLDSDNFTMDETGIAWDSDSKKFAQPDGFTYTPCGSGVCEACLVANSSDSDSSSDYSDCGIYTDSSGETWAYYYPESSTTQYLYESYPDVISPLEGVKNEHFMVWMRSAALDSFRKPYGIIYDDIPAGTALKFNVTANWLVTEFKGKKYLIVANTGWYGLANPFLGRSFVAFGIIQVLMACMMVIKEKVSPRVLGDIKVIFG